MKQKNEVVQNVPLTGRDVITSEDVSRVVHGDKQALIEQLARAKQVAVEQLEARKQAEANGLNTTTMKSKEELEKEIIQKEAELNMALASMSSVTTEQKQKIHQFDNTSNVGVQTLSNQSPNKLGTVSKNNNIYNGQINNSNMPNNINQNVNTNQVPNTNQVSNTNTVSNITSNSVNNKLTKKQLREQKQLLKEQRKKQKQLMKEERRKNSNLKYYMTLFLFIAIFAMVYFLPNISSYFSKLKSERELANSAVITTGTLECNLKKYDKKFDYLYESIFTYKDNMLLKLSYKVTTKGDQTIDADELSLLNQNCNNLREHINSLEGISVRCSLNNGVNINEEELRYSLIDVDKVTTAYLEAGGVYPNYKYNEDIDKVEKSMKASGYTCNRYK